MSPGCTTSFAGLLIILGVVLGLMSGLSRQPVPDQGPGTYGCWQIDLETATLPELQLLPGIGSVLAQRIHEWRLECLSSCSIEHLDDIYGVGQRTIERLRPLVAEGKKVTPDEFKITD